VKDLDAEHTRTTSDVQRPVVRAKLLSALRVLREQITGFRGRLTKLRTRLPQAEPPAKKAVRKDARKGR
jgi:small-conductance mechanosensitive channel